MAVCVFPSHENVSRQALLSWVNDKLSSKILKIEDMCRGEAYCFLMEQLFPGTVSMKRVRTNSRVEYDCIVNFKLLQEAFNKLSVDKVVPVEKLVKGRFQDNFEFMQWFKKFYDANSNLSSSGSESKSKTANTDTSKGKEKSASTKHALGCSSKPSNDSHATENQEVLQDKEMKISHVAVNEVTRARDFYLTKLNRINMICQENVNDAFCRKILEIIEKEPSPHHDDTDNLDEDEY